MKLWERITRGMEAGFEAALVSVHKLTEKAGESIELTRLRREKARCENMLTRLLAELGSITYEKISKERLNDISAQLGAQEKIMEIAENEAIIIKIDKSIGKELESQPEEIQKDDDKESVKKE